MLYKKVKKYLIFIKLFDNLSNDGNKQRFVFINTSLEFFMEIKKMTSGYKFLRRVNQAKVI